MEETQIIWIIYHTNVSSTEKHIDKSMERIEIALPLTMGQYSGCENLHRWGEVGGGMLSPLRKNFENLYTNTANARIGKWSAIPIMILYLGYLTGLLYSLSIALHER
jgi:hypothetical protein